MKTLLSFGYALTRWLILLAFGLTLLLLFFIEYPVVLLELAKSPLKELGISYGEIKGGILSGFEINNLNYQNNVTAKKVGVKIDFEQLQNRVLHIQELELEDLNIDKKYLSDLIDTKSGKKKESNSSLPFDKIVVDSANISLSHITYKKYFIKSLKVKVKNLKSDLKQQYIGDIYMLLDSNIANLDLNTSINKKNVNISSTIEPKSHFLYTFTKDYNLTFTSNPLFTLKGEGNIKKLVKYELTTHRLGFIQNEHQIDSDRFLLMGSYDIAHKTSVNHLDSHLFGSMAEISLIVDTTLNIEDINNSLQYDADLNASLNEIFLTNLLEEHNLTFLASPQIQLKSEGNLNHLTYNLMAQNLNLKQNEYKLNSGNLSAYGDYSIFSKDVTTTIHTKLDSSVASPLSLDLEATLNLNDINNTLTYKADINTSVKDNFLTNLLQEQNLIFLASPTIQLKSEGDFNHLTYNLMAQNLYLKQNEYTLNSGNISAYGDYSILNKDVTTTIDTQLNSNIATPFSLNLEAKLNLDDINNTLTYKTNIDTTIKQAFLTDILQEQNLTFLASPHIKLKSEGSFEHLTYNLMAQNLNLKQNEYRLNSGDFSAQGEYSILHKDITTLINSNLSSNLADPIKIDLEAKLNLEDINNSLRYNFKANITPNKEFIESRIPDNISIEKIAPLNILAKGSLLETEFKINFEHLSASREDLEAEINSLSLMGNSNILTGDIKVDASTKFNSTVGEGHIKDHLTLNFNDLENSLKYNAQIEIDASSNYLNTLITDKSLEVKGVPKVKLTLEGDMRKLTLKLNAQAQMLKDKKISKVDIQSSPILLNLKEHTVEGKLKIVNESDNLGLLIDIDISGDYTKPKKLKIKSNVEVKNFNAFGINLDSLAPIDVKIDNGKNGTTFTIHSKRLNLIATTPDQDHFSFELHTGKLYLYKMMTLPQALDHKFVKLDIKGEATLSTQHFSLQGDLYSNKKFHANIDAKNGRTGLNAMLKSNYLTLLARGDIKSKNIEIILSTTSLDKLQNELYSLYKFEKIAIDGAIKVTAKLAGENIQANINSNEILFDGFNIEKIDIDALYTKELITINKLNFNTIGFEDSRLNRAFYLNQKAMVHLGERRDVLLDMHPNIFVELKGDKEFLEGDFKITKLPLGHPNYGSMVLSTEVHYLQEGKKKSITGDIFLKKMKLFYEAKFLDIDHDPDVIIITKDDKINNEKSEDNFLENTSIALTIHAPEANYRTPDIDLLFDIKVEANKAFGEELALFGKIEEINGRFDQVPKRFNITHSNIVFKGGKKINPLLDIHVEYELPQVLININIGGSAERPKIEFTSEPPMPKKDIISYLLLGVSTASFANGEGSVSREAELFIINQAARDLSYEMEFDRVFVKDDGTGEGFAIEVGKKISPKNMIIIETSKEGNSIILEHDISKNIKLRVGHHQKEIPSQSIDIFFRKRFK